MVKNVFELSNIDCAYKKAGEEPAVILSVKKLDIPLGKMVFIIGPSGIGKSTILETLGMMNNTLVVHPDSRFVYHNPGDDQTVNIIDMWKRNKDKELSAFRRNNFSFIFQQTNLMHNFSAYHNVMITAMLQGQSQRDSAVRAKSIFTTIKMPVFNMLRKPTELSGGQQQRLAFARAIIPRYNILFGDEPTGNLDSYNASLLIAQMREQILSDLSSSAIIVSHDLYMSVKYADLIIKIQEVKDKFGEISRGVIDEHSVFEKRENGYWYHLDKKYNDDELLTYLKENIHENELEEE